MSIAEKLTTIAENEPKVFEAGKKAEYDEFWDAFQNNGNRTDYYAGFRGWNGVSFKPKYNIKPATAYMLLAYFDDGKASADRIDLVEHLEELGVTLDFSNTTNFQYAFWTCRINRIGIIDTRKASALNQTFDIYSGHTIDKLILKADGSQTFSNTFRSASVLKNLTIEGVIGKNGFNVSWSTALTHDSLMSIINALQDKSADTSGTTWLVTLGTDNIAKLTAEELNIIESKGWTYG